MATSYGSITIVDITDIGEFSLYPTCDLPLSVIYTPDNNNYTPNWGTSGSNLHLTPVVYYAGNALALNASGLSITWTRKVDSDSASAISSSRGETISNGVLTVAQNQFNTNMAMLTYICTATYAEPDTGKSLTAQGQITFSLIKQAATLKNCTIIGESAFKYNSARTTVVPATIELTAQITDNLTNGKWQYKDSQGDWTDFSTTTHATITGATITISPTESAIFVNDVATIRKLCSDYVSEVSPGTYDIHTITKLYDGVAGDSTVAAVLDNEDQLIPCDADNDPTIDLSTVQATFMVLEGGTTASGWTYSAPTTSPANTITGSWNSTTHTWTLSTWTGNSDVATITFQATKTGYNPLTKYLQLTKIKTGQDGTSPEYYELVCSTVAVNRTATGNIYTPNTVTFSANKVVGSTKTAYRGYVDIYVNGTGSSVGGAMSDTATPSFTYTPSGGTLEYLTVHLKQTSGGGDILDRQTVVVTSDGEGGATGPGALNIVLGNSHEGIPCTSAGATIAQRDVTIPFTGYKGTARQACSITSANVTGLPTGVTVYSVSNDNGTNSGSIVLRFANNSTLGGSSSGEITLTFTINGTTIPMKFSWSKTFAGANADPVITFQCYGKSGDIIYNNSNTVVLTSQLLEGATEKTATSYTWTQWGGTNYTISRGTTKELTINPAWIDGYGAFRCAAVYNSKTYYSYISVRDVTDPLQIQVYSTLGEQLVNGVGDGAVFVRVMLNNEEVDTIKSTNFVTNTSQVTSPTSGDYCYLLNKTNATCTLMQYNGSSWQTVNTDPYDYNYTWTFRNNLGEATTYNGNATMTGKALYLGASVINKKLVMDVEVSEK
jgi:hypothetical protein